jgi:Fic family protein
MAHAAIHRYNHRRSAVNRTYIHHLADWPQFFWDSNPVAEALLPVRHRQGLLLGRMSSLSPAAQQDASLAALTDDAVRTSAIEGEALEPASVRSSIARNLHLNRAGLEAPSRGPDRAKADAIVTVLLDATQRFAAPLTRERLFGWHAALFPTGFSGMRRIEAGQWRTDRDGPMQVVSGRDGRERVHFEAPAAARVATEMTRFLDWFERRDTAVGGAHLDPVLRAGVAHLWFLTIHPFDDGNGRIGRAIADMALARGDGSSLRFYSLSAAIEANKDEYWNEIERAQRASLDITRWLLWFIECLDQALARAAETTEVVRTRAAIWALAERERPLHARQRLVLARLLGEQGEFEGFLNSSKYAKLAKCSTDTALRDITDLLARGVLARNSAGGRSASYRVANDR